MNILPENQHFHSVKELKHALTQSIDNFRLPYEVNDENDTFFNPENETFEVLLNKQNEKILIPDAKMYPFLFRGQQKEWLPCLPSLYRERNGKKPNDIEIFIDRLRLTEFAILLNTHPVVSGFFKKHNFKIDYIGLAQHYGLNTEILDFTNDLDIALFFSLCSYNKALNCYEPNLNDGSHTAILYVIVPVFYIDFGKKSFLDNKISVIGMQPFKRPGAQKGFAFHFKQDESFNVFRYTFSYTKDDSKCIYDKFEQGKKLWVQDILAEKTRSIASQISFSVYTFNQTCVNCRVKGLSKSKLKDSLLNVGIQISTHIEIPKFNTAERCAIVDEWNNQQSIQAINQIRRRFWREKVENTDQAGKRYEFRTIQMLMEIELLRLVGNRSDLGELDLNQSNTTPCSTNSTLSNNKVSESWEKVPGRFELAKSETFLTESNCLIS
ncbi:hypothetical protein AGMMS50239_06450 [Bacteroidia bacterium]|nr:hypothetical protein AGMMS50239_06450 [Bacteroidia bacterium]